MPKSRGRKPKKKRAPASAPKKRLDNFNTTPQEPPLLTQPPQEPLLGTAPRQEQPTKKKKKRREPKKGEARKEVSRRTERRRRMTIANIGRHPKRHRRATKTPPATNR